MSSFALACLCSIPLALLGIAGAIVELVKEHRENTMLHNIFDGDRMQYVRPAKGKKYGGYTFEIYETERRYY